MDQHKKNALLMAVERLENSVGAAAEALATIKSIMGDGDIVLKPKYDLDDPKWPVAIPAEQITNDDQKVLRAQQVVAIIRERLKSSLVGMNILDFGCGDGHTTAAMAAEASTTVLGYDINAAAVVANDNYSFTVDRQQVGVEPVYDLIVLYDVLDHIENEDPVDVLTWLATTLKPDGKIFVRTHPWTSRHGGHLYKVKNKAFMHMVLSEEELKPYERELPRQRVTRPNSTYEKWFRSAKLSVVSRKTENAAVGDYFSGEVLQRIINNTWGGNIDETTAARVMTMQYIDYVLGRK